MTEVFKYAEALLLLAKEEGMPEEIRADLCAINTVLSDNPEYTRILDTPALPKDERMGLVDEAFGSLSEYARNLLKMLCTAHLTHAFARLYAEFTRLYNDMLGITEVEAVSAVKLKDEEIARLKAGLEKKLGRTVSLKNTVDRRILGGLVIRYDSKQLDGSVKTRLDKIGQSLKSVVI